MGDKKVFKGNGRRPVVLIDGIAFENRYHIGTWRVFYECINRLGEDVDFYILLEKNAANPLPVKSKILLSNHRRQGSRITRWINEYSKRKSISFLSKHFKEAIWHSTYFSPDPRYVKRSVVHVYDMIAEHYYHLSALLEHQCDLKRHSILSADSAISISKSTTTEFLRFFPSFKGRVITAPLGSEHIRNDSKSDVAREAKCIFVGHRNSYKNFHVVIRALACPKWPDNVRLDVVGLPLLAQETELINYYGVGERVSYLGKLTDEQLALEYKRSQALIFPSLSEGFGLPVLEAQANGCIPILSDIPIFHEVSGDFAFYFNPTNPDSVAESVANCFSAAKDEMRLKCYNNAGQYSWDKTAELTLQCYQRLWGNY